MRDLGFPLRLNPSVVYSVGSVPTRDKIFGQRLSGLKKICEKWSLALHKVWDEDIVPNNSKTWKDFSYEDPYNRDFTDNPSFLMELLTLDGGIPYDFNAIHRSQHLWYKENLPYRKDCAVLLVKMINNFWWAKRQGHKAFILTKPWAFPILNYITFDGPWIPPNEPFGPHDRQLVLDDGHMTFFFMYGKHELDLGVELTVTPRPSRL